SNTPLISNGKTPLGTASVLQVGDPHYVPVPIVTSPDMPRSPQAPMAQVPQAPQLNQRYPNAITCANMPVAPPMPMNERAGSAYSPNPYPPEPAPGARHQSIPSVVGYSSPTIVLPGCGIMGQGQYLPLMPSGPVVQPGFYGPPLGQGIAPAGYPMQPYPGQQRILVQQRWNSTADPASLLSQLRYASLPSQREWAGIELGELDWHKYSGVVEALVQAAKQDPAATVRSGCVHCLAKMDAKMPSVIAVLSVLKGDCDPRVQKEASEALARLAPGQMPMMQDRAVQPASASL